MGVDFNSDYRSSESDEPNTTDTVILVPTKILSKFAMLVLDEAYNDDAISYDSNRADGDDWVFGSLFPAEELPESNSIVMIQGTPFICRPSAIMGHI